MWIKLLCYELLFVVGKAFPSDGVPETKESSLVVYIREMLVDFVPTISGLSLAEAPAFKKLQEVHLLMLLLA